VIVINETSNGNVEMNGLISMDAVIYKNEGVASINKIQAIIFLVFICNNLE
jgi:hypothetical protein